MSLPSWIAPAPQTPAAPPWERVAAVTPPAEETEAPVETAPAIDLVAIAAREAELLNAIAERDAEIERLRAQAVDTANAMKGFVTEFVENAEPEIVRLAVAIAERVVGSTSVDPGMIVDFAREALSDFAAGRNVVVAIAPDLAAAFDGQVFGETAKITVDATLPPTSCELRSGPRVLVVSTQARLRAVAEAVGVEAA